MLTLPITLVASLFSILANFPVTSVNEWFKRNGLSEQFNAMVGGTLNIISIFIVIGISYTYTKRLNKPKGNPLVAAILSLAAFIIFMPQTMIVGKENVAGLSFDYLGSNGIFVAMVLGLVISRVYIALSQHKKILIKLPDSVPPMVVESFEPLVIAVITLTGVILVRIGLSLTPLGNLFDVIQIVIAGPLTKLGGSIPSLLAIAVIGNLLYFFGIHPNAINGVITPITLTMALANVEAFKVGAHMPYRDILITSSFFGNDGTGNTLSLLLAILIFGKSARYRSLSKVTLVPNIFNINEPVVFGMPIAFNPLLAIPFLLAPVISGMIGYIGVISGFIVNYNPITGLGLAYLWTLPKIITSYLTMGWQGLVLRVISIIAMIFVYLPFVKLLEKQEALEEQQNIS
ncbi:PTS sugar transporter subunit IIC [Enterococcus gallinarum]|uniref:PTS sugar transporter subunit IIC n=1 Tax=Enterococcus gallinarum TaxID=1353 RepID=UPI003D6A967F